MALTQRLFPNCIYLPGLKHTMDNIMHDILDSLSNRETFLGQLRGFEGILRSPNIRDKLSYVFFNEDSDAIMRQRLKAWRSSLRSLRWHELCNFIRELKTLQVGLQKKWSLQRFLLMMPQERQSDGTFASNDIPGEGRGQAGGAYAKQVDSAVHSNFFWAYAEMVLQVISVADILSHWSEGCFYHGSSGCCERSCVYKGCRSPELAAGLHLYLLKELQCKGNMVMTQLSPSLRQEEAQRLLLDWHAAHGRLSTEIQFRLAFWQTLPWKLCGVAAQATDVARVIASQCLALFRGLTDKEQRRSHPVTRRLCDPLWRGLGLVSKS